MCRDAFKTLVSNNHSKIEDRVHVCTNVGILQILENYILFHIIVDKLVYDCFNYHKDKHFGKFGRKGLGTCFLGSVFQTWWNLEIIHS